MSNNSEISRVDESEVVDQGFPYGEGLGLPKDMIEILDRCCSFIKNRVSSIIDSCIGK